MENSVDPVHLEWLHGHHLAAVRRAHGLAAPSRYGRRHAEIGFDVFPHGIIKRRVLEGGSRDDDDWRIGHPLVFPVMVRVGVHPQHRFQIRVPVDDTHTLHLWYSCYFPPEGAAAPVQAEIPVYEVPFRDEHGRFLVDFVDGGDIMTWVSQGGIADRTREMLVDTDRGVVLLRQLFLEQIARVQAGEDPLGVVRSPAANEMIELPQEREKYGRGDAFLREALAMSHVATARSGTASWRSSGLGEVKAMRVLCHAQHLSGVGHFVRMHAIASGLGRTHDVYLVDGGRRVPRAATRPPSPAAAAAASTRGRRRSRPATSGVEACSRSGRGAGARGRAHPARRGARRPLPFQQMGARGRDHLRDRRRAHRQPAGARLLLVARRRAPNALRGRAPGALRGTGARAPRLALRRHPRPRGPRLHAPGGPLRARGGPVDPSRLHGIRRRRPGSIGRRSTSTTRCSAAAAARAAFRIY